MGDIGPYHTKNARVPGKMAFGKFWQLTIEARWQVSPGLMHVLFNQMVVVDQPLGGWRHTFSSLHRTQHIFVVTTECGTVLVKPVNEGIDTDGTVSHGLGFCQAVGVLVETLAAKYFCRDGVKLVQRLCFVQSSFSKQLRHGSAYSGVKGNPDA